MTDRPTAATITDEQLAELYADLDHYEEHIVGDLNEKNIGLARRAARAEATLDRVRALRDDLRGITGARYIADALDTILDEQPGPAATELRAALAEALTHLYALTRVDGSTIGWQTANPISPAAYDRWQTALHPPTPTPPVPCPACTRAEQAGLDPTEQHPNCRTQETR
jgi:hypothetical protein